MNRRAALVITFGLVSVSSRARADDPAPPALPAATASASASASVAPAAKTDADGVAEVRVSGLKPRETGGSVYEIGKKQLQRFAYDDPQAVLRAVPGVYARGEDGYGLRPNLGMRGASSDRSKKLTLMEDGVLFAPAPYSAPAAYYFPLIERMVRVKVVKGPASIFYGPQTVGGAIDLVTHPIPTQRRGSFKATFGSYAMNKLQLGYGAGDEQAGFYVEGVRMGTTGFKELDGGGNTGFVRNEWMAKARYTLNPGARTEQELSLKLGYSDEDSRETYLGLNDGDFRATPYRRYAASALDRMSWHRTAIALTHRVSFSRNTEILTTVYRHDLSRAWRKANRLGDAALSDVLAGPESGRNAVFMGVLRGQVDATSDAETLYIGPNNRTFVSQGLQTAVRHHFATGPLSHKVEYGARIHYDSVERLHTEDGFRMTAGQLVPAGTATLTTANNLDSSHALAMYASDVVSIGPATLMPGVRLETIYGRSENRLTRELTGGIQRVLLPGMGGYWAFTKELGILGGVYKGFSPAPPGNVRLVAPEESWNFETGARWNGKRVRADLIGFWNEYSNLTDVCTFSNGCVGSTLDRQFDAGSARVYGVEALVEAELKASDAVWIPLRASYTYTASEFLNDFVSADPIYGRVRGGYGLPYVPTHQGSGSVGVETGDVSLNVSVTYLGAMREQAGLGDVPGQSTDAATLIDASSQYAVTRAIKLFVHGRNLTNRSYVAARRPYGARPGAPLFVLAGAKVEF